ncbi:DUF1715-domain-containing protein [Trichodelitschia bisporula]|uniref:DUF1715-domain-containing protein n=1 Tax=Trichodelitschia bisporula TaxID=703511 RepID=A0A6G1IB20_9PEZI|nr:DUF1715-domain-containing protein [Trichodelitschia bisporula]
MDDLFDDILNLEDRYYEEGYQEGVQDGSRAGRIEGRVFGLEKAFEKFVAVGALHGQACVWAVQSSRVVSDSTAPASSQLEALPSNPRLERHITALYALSEPESLSTQNTEEAVSDFDDRYKRAISKAKVIENIIGVRRSANVDAPEPTATRRESQPVRLAHVDPAAKNMEDFGSGRS